VFTWANSDSSEIDKRNGPTWANGHNDDESHERNISSLYDWANSDNCDGEWKTKGRLCILVCRCLVSVRLMAPVHCLGQWRKFDGCQEDGA
jgi:hypothetical protein